MYFTVKPSTSRRILAGFLAFVVLLLAALTVSPTAHRALHGGHGQAATKKTQTRGAELASAALIGEPTQEGACFAAGQAVAGSEADGCRPGGERSPPLNDELQDACAITLFAQGVQSLWPASPLTPLVWIQSGTLTSPDKIFLGRAAYRLSPSRGPPRVAGAISA